MFTVWRCYLSKNLEIYSTSSFDRRWKTVSNKKETRRAVGDNYAYAPPALTLIFDLLTLKPIQHVFRPMWVCFLIF